MVAAKASTAPSQVRSVAQMPRKTAWRCVSGYCTCYLTCQTSRALHAIGCPISIQRHRAKVVAVIGVWKRPKPIPLIIASGIVSLGSPCNGHGAAAAASAPAGARFPA